MQVSSKEQFLPGFRISIVDALVLAAGTAGSAFLAEIIRASFNSPRPGHIS